MTRVLIAVDESLVSLRAAQEGARLFSDAEFLMINVARRAVPWVGDGGLGAGYPMEYGAAFPIEVAELPAVGLHYDELGTLAVEAGLDSAELLTVEGIDAAQAICAAAEEHEVDVIVVGAHDKGMLNRLLNPSVSNAVLDGTNRPVLVVNECSADS